jgi:nucleotide-binding universal stress UspA family protein
VHARHLGLKAEGLAVADEVTVADTLLRLAGENDSQAIVVGNTTRRAITEILVGSTTRALLRRATCPVVVVRAPVDGEHGS